MQENTTTVTGYCEGFSTTSFSKSCKFILLNEIGRTIEKEIKQLHPKANNPNLADDDERHTKLNTIKELAFISIPCFYNLPSYSPCLIYTLEISVKPEESIYCIKEILDIKKRWSNCVISKDFITHYFQYTLKFTNIKTMLGSLPKLITEMKDVSDVEDINEKFKKEIISLIALTYKSNTFIRLLKFFPSSFLCKFNHKELVIFEKYLQDPDLIHFLIFKNLFRNEFVDMADENSGKLLFPKETFSWRIGCVHNMSEWRDQFFDYHPQFILLNQKKLLQLKYMNSNEINLISQALQIYNSYEYTRKNQLHTLVNIENSPLNVINYLEDKRILISPSLLILNNSLTDMENLVGDPFELIEESEIWKKLSQLNRIFINQISDFDTNLFQEINQLLMEIDGNYLILSDNVTTAEYVYKNIGVEIYYFENNYLDDITSTLKGNNISLKRKKNKEENPIVFNPFSGIRNIIILRTNKVTTRNITTIFNLIESIESTNIYMFGDVDEHLNNSINIQGYGTSSNLFNLLFEKFDDPFPNCVRRYCESNGVTLNSKMKEIFEKGSWGKLNVKYADGAIKAMAAYLKWNTDRKKESKRGLDKSIIQLFCNNSSFRFDFIKEINQKNNINFDMQVFYHSDKVIVTSMGLCGIVKKAQRKVIEEDSSVNWVDVYTKTPIKTHLNEYQLRIERICNGKNVIVNTSAHQNNIKHAFMLLYKDHIGNMIDYAFIHIDSTTNLKDIFSIIKYVRKDVIFVLEKSMTLDKIKPHPKTNPSTLIGFLLQ